VSWQPLGHEKTPAFIDASRIWSVLDGVRAAPNLYDIATEKFAQPDSALDHRALDQEAFALLVTDEFLAVPLDLRNDIERFRQLDRDGDRTRGELTTTYRQLRTLQVQHRRATRDHESSSGFLRSKSKKWEAAQRVGELDHEIEDLTLKRRRMESDLDKCGALLRSLLDRVYRDQVLRDGHWYCEIPVLVTHHGDFLYDYLADMNPAHFHGRTLVEILEIGPSLA